MADPPSVLIISCSNTNPDDIIKLILNTSEPPEKQQLDEDIHAYPWKIDNKYYTAELRLCSLNKKTISNKHFSDSVEAVILHFDSSENNALDKIDSWLSFINEYQPEIKILVCKNISGEDNSKRTIQEWCINTGFELVELEPISEDLNDEVEDDFQETTGVKRIIQALNAHVWPNLVMKASQKTSNLNNSAGQSQAELNDLRKQLCLEQSLEEMLEKDDDFSQLFCQLSEMKSRVANLSGDDRKAAAEQVVKAFWKAMGGDEDECLDL